MGLHFFVFSLFEQPNANSIDDSDNFRAGKVRVNTGQLSFQRLETVLKRRLFLHYFK